MQKVNIIFRPVYLEVNQGHGNARRAALANCSNSLVALMDADDISLPNRFYFQLQAFRDNKYLDVIGGQISEFIGSPDNIIDWRVVPENDKDIKEYMKKRCPFNQVTVMFKKEFVESVGGYMDWYCEEDYYLWIRMAQAGGNFGNVRQTLVNVRVGDEMSARRGGWKYFLSEAKLQKYMLSQGIISLPRFIYNVVIRFGGEVVLSDSMRTKLFKYMRNDNKGNLSEHIVDTTNKELEMNRLPFSVAMCVYEGDNAEWFDMALNSIVNQTVPPTEIVLVVDGPIPHAIQNVIDKYEAICRRRILNLK